MGHPARFSGNDALEFCATDLPCGPSAQFAPRTVILGRGSSWGFGLRGDARLPFSGPVRLIHWVISPYGDTPAGGIVEDCASLRLRRVFGQAPSGLRVIPVGASSALPSVRRDRRNLVTGTQLMGLRAWDIPHDRHMCVMELASGAAEVSGFAGPPSWYPVWRLLVELAGKSVELLVERGEVVNISLRPSRAPTA